MRKFKKIEEDAQPYTCNYPDACNCAEYCQDDGMATDVNIVATVLGCLILVGFLAAMFIQ